jgi:DNA-binding CsgD family transcriptional regulator
LTLERQVLALVGNVMGLLEIDDFVAGLLVAVREAVPCDWVSFNEVAPDPERTLAVVDPPLSAAMLEIFGQLVFENPLVAHYQRTGDGRAVRFSDVVSRRELHATELYRRFYAPLGIEHQIAFTLPSSPERLLAIALSRGGDDFTDRERDLLNLARHHLIQAYRNALAHSQLARLRHQRASSDRDASLERIAGLGLTRREAQVLLLVCMGRSDRDAALELGVSHRTVEKHLENCYRKLAVGGRSEAATLVWAAIGSP